VNSPHPTLLNIPENAMLIAFGNCFHSDQYGWLIATYFKMPNGEIKEVKGKSAVEPREIIHFSLPPIAAWEKLTIKEVSTTLHEAHYLNECQNQPIYKITLENRIFWLPVLELARVLFLKTAENSRRAFYEPSLDAMANLYLSHEQATIRLSKHYPRKLLDTKAHQEYLAWLLLNPTVTQSFGSIYKSKNDNATHTSKFQRWVFNFEPFELRNVTVNCFINSHEHEYLMWSDFCRHSNLGRFMQRSA
jgi:hypothetical protein